MNTLQIAILGGCLAALTGCQRAQTQKTAGPPPAVPVSVAKAAQESVPAELHAVGTVEASEVVQVKSQVPGQLLRVRFHEGDIVKQGEPLLDIDPQPYQDALRQAEAAVERDRAQITQAEASLARDTAQSRYAELDAARQKQLSDEKLAAKMTADQAVTALDVSRAAARATEATIATARAAMNADLAAVAKAKLDLSRCVIPAPITGRTGNLLVHAGNLIKENDAAIVVIHRVAPIFVSFSVPEAHLAAIRRLDAAHRLVVRVSPQNDATHSVAGKLAVIDNTVDASTGTIHLKAVFENRDSVLWPGQFVNAVLVLDTLRNATVVPGEAVQSGQRGDFVFVVKPDNTVEMRPVTTGAAAGKRIVIEKGVAPGDTVVTDGQLRLFPGAAIRAVDAGQLGSGPL